MRSWPTKTLALGGDYNPEQWPRPVWDEDIELMQRANISFVSLGIFSWSWLEPAKGEYEFEWLDTIMDKLHAGGIAVDLATATATPPPWLSAAHPEILPVDVDGHTLWPGSRQTWCPTSPVFREYALALTRQLATRYHEHPALAMWHVSNEYALPQPALLLRRVRPALPRLAAAPLRRRSRRSTTRGARPSGASATPTGSRSCPPRRSTTFNNPTHVLDYKRFSSDALLEHMRAERAVLDELSPGVPVTTNFMTLEHFRHLDYSQWTPTVDVVSTDHYIVDALEHPRAELAFSGDLTRGLAGGAPWMLMEHSTSAVNWQPTNHAKAPGQTIRDALAHVARGADTIGVVPVAPVARRLREVPQRRRAARRRRQRPLPRGRGARPHRRPPRRARRQPGRVPRRDPP